MIKKPSRNSFIETIFPRIMGKLSTYEYNIYNIVLFDIVVIVMAEWIYIVVEHVRKHYIYTLGGKTCGKVLQAPSIFVHATGHYIWKNCVFSQEISGQ